MRKSKASLPTSDVFENRSNEYFSTPSKEYVPRRQLITQIDYKQLAYERSAPAIKKKRPLKIILKDQYLDRDAQRSVEEAYGRTKSTDKNMHDAVKKTESESILSNLHANSHIPTQ